MQALILQRIDLAFRAPQHDRNAADLDPFNLVLRKLVAEERRIPVIDESPRGILVRLILALGGARIAIVRGLTGTTAAHNWLIGHGLLPP
ncbi:hypothetical protein [Burkholderia anthina]|uniref:hypothetical protein n=1 Tax=Burkholderia anthina TaxID=179879 RepID=UPI001FC84BAA|nr:hypothetical protein [Burkholderia anthina]